MKIEENTNETEINKADSLHGQKINQKLPEQGRTRDPVLQTHRICNKSGVSRLRDLERIGNVLQDLHH